ncbi:MAG: hypothetical protein ACP5HS_03900 [Anaerolineae bacterium]
MFVTILLVALVAVGVALAVHAVLLLRGRGEARPIFLERPMVDVVASGDKAEARRVLGRLRLVYGFFLIAIGLWGLLG